MNEIKSIVYAAGGDDKTYSLLENVFAFASSAMIPIGTAGKAGELTFRSGIVMLGKEGVSTLAGYGASNLVYDKTNNQTLGMIAGILASMGSAKGLNMTDAKLGWSNKGVKGNVVESVTGDIESGLDTSWYKPDGSINYPPNNGAVPGTEVNMTLKPGSTLGRYGNIGEKSNFVTQTGADASKLALPPNTNPAIYQEFEVIKEIPGTIQAEIAPWGGSAGGGLQYELPKPILQLIKEGYIVPK